MLLAILGADRIFYVFDYGLTCCDICQFFKPV